MTVTFSMRLARDTITALLVGTTWGIVVSEIIRSIAAASTERSPALEVLASGHHASFVLLSLAQDFAAFLVPSLLAGYLLVRLIATRPMLPFAFVAALPSLLATVPGVSNALMTGWGDDARGLYLVLNTLLALAMIPACTSLIQRFVKDS